MKFDVLMPDTKNEARAVSFSSAYSLFIYLIITGALRFIGRAIVFPARWVELLFTICGALLSLSALYFSFGTVSRKLNIKSISIKKNPSFSPVCRVALTLLCFSGIFLFGKFYVMLFPDASTLSTAKNASVFEHILTLLSYVLIPAFFEELVYRGCFAREFCIYGKNAAILLSALLFGLSHFSFTLFPYSFICGFIIGTAYVVSGSLTVAVGIHFLNNFSGYVLTALKPMISESAYNNTVAATTFIALAIFAFSAAFLSVKVKKPLFTEEAEHCKSWDFLTHPMMLYLLCAFAAHLVL